MASSFVEYPSSFGTKTTYKIAHAGYTYHIKVEKCGAKYYYCDSRDVCNASIILRKGKWSYGRASWNPNGTHQHHQPNRDRVVAEIVKGEAKQMAKDNLLLSTEQVVQKTFEEAPIDSQEYLPSPRQAKRIIQRSRSSNWRIPEPTTLEGMKLPDFVKRTSKDDAFLKFDNGEEDRILIFSTDDNLKELCKQDTLFMDGTFKSCPKIFGRAGQLYTIHGYYSEQDSEGRVRALSLPLVYALLPNKSESTYDIFIRQVRQMCSSIGARLKPRTIIVDFEMGMINVLYREFVHSKVSGCYFHLMQSLYRRIQHEGLQARYLSDMKFRDNVKMLGSLAFVPPDHVLKRFIQISQMLPSELSGILNYFKHTYVEGQNGRPPLFAIALWNVYDRVKKRVPRTSNYIEGWHNRFRLSMQAFRPALWKFLIILHKEQQRTENLLFKMKFGKALELQKRKYRNINTAIQNLCKSYKKRTTSLAKFQTWIRGFSQLIPQMSEK